MLTPDFRKVLTFDPQADLFARFEEDSCTAYNIMRRHPHQFISLFSLMLSTGMPELEKETDLDYMREELKPDLSNEAAADQFKKLIEGAKNDPFKVWDNATHSFVHPR